MTFALICDMHMTEEENSPQYSFFKQAIKKIKEDKIEDIITLGDISAFGEAVSLKRFLAETEGLDSHFVIGNADVRDEATAKEFIDRAKNFKIDLGNRTIFAINVYDANISAECSEFLTEIADGDILMMHYSIQALNEESRRYIEELAGKYSLEIIHAHSHKHQDYTLGKSRVRGLRALDPDKSIGYFPCITYMNISENEINLTEVVFKPSKEAASDMFSHFGISCVDNLRDMKYAAEHRLYAAELRTNGADWVPDLSILPEIENWRNQGGKYLSVHMPNVKWADGEIKGAENWRLAVDFAKAVGVDGLTMHPPRVKKTDMEKGGEVWNEFLSLYTYAVSSMADSVKIGIENLHTNKAESESGDYSFGYVPCEVEEWISAINEKCGVGRVGHLLDVGHARNNGLFSSTYPIGRWYTKMGAKAVAYHIHQVVPTENGMGNHYPIENWFGPMINYTGFMYAWENDILNHGTIFLEVRGAENYDKSIEAFKRCFL